MSGMCWGKITSICSPPPPNATLNVHLVSSWPLSYGSAQNHANDFRIKFSKLTRKSLGTVPPLILFGSAPTPRSPDPLWRRSDSIVFPDHRFGAGAAAARGGARRGGGQDGRVPFSGDLRRCQSSAKHYRQSLPKVVYSCFSMKMVLSCVHIWSVDLFLVI